jgi:hypothetical protein
LGQQLLLPVRLQRLVIKGQRQEQLLSKHQRLQDQQRIHCQVQMAHLVKCFPLTVLERFLGLLLDQLQPHHQQLIILLLLRVVEAAEELAVVVVPVGIEMELHMRLLLPLLTQLPLVLLEQRVRQL